MTTTPPSPSSPVVELTAAEIAKLIRISITQTFHLGKKDFQVKTDSHQGCIEVLYLNGPKRSEMKALVEKYQRGYDRTGRTFTVEGDSHVYISKYTLSIFCTRRVSADFVARCARLHCRRVQKPLPEIIDGRISSRDEQLKQEIKDLIANTNEADLAPLELEAEALPPPPEISEEEATYRTTEAERRRLAELRAWEIARQQQLFCLQVYQAINASERVSEVQAHLNQIARKTRALALEYQDPVVCSFCFAVGEKNAFQAIGQYAACPACVEQETAGLSSQDLEAPHLFPQDGEDVAPQPKALLLEDAFSPRLTPDEDGIYHAKNGEIAPILTRDLLHEIRFGIWWLAFEHKPEATVRQALLDAGWDWSPIRRQWYHPNKFGVVPPIIFEVYGGYIDAGFSVYRELRGERLRGFATRIDGKAEQAWDLSNEIIQKYMSTGTLVVGPRRTRSLQKKKARAEALARTAQELDSYAHKLRERANRSEHHQERVTRTSMLRQRIKELGAESRKLERDFHDMVERASQVYNDSQSSSYRDLVAILAEFEETSRRQEIIQEEIDWLQTVVEERLVNASARLVTYTPHDVPSVPQREYAVSSVVEVNVGAENRLDLHPTPPDLGDRLLNDDELFPIPPHARRCLEPHGGTGSLLRCIQRYLREHGMQAELHTCELNWQLNGELRKQGFQVVGDDFLEYHPDGIRYDAIIANPPFSNWMAHIEHMLELLAEGGTLLAILPMSFFGDKPQIKAFRQQVEENGAYIEIERGVFKESGTDVPVVLVSLQL